MKRAAKGTLPVGGHQSLGAHVSKPSGSTKQAPRDFLRAVSTLACAGCLFATDAKAIDVANQTDWNTAVAAVAAAGANSTVDINITSGFTLASSLAQIQASNANVTVNITGNSQTIDGASSFQGIQVNGANAPTVHISNLSVANTAAIGGNGQNGQNGYFSGGLSYGSGGGGGGGLGAGGGLLVGSGANVTLASVTFTGNAATGGTGGNGGSAQNAAADPVNGGNGGAGGAANNGGASGGGGAGGTGGHAGTQGTTGTAGASLGDGGGGGGGSGTTNSSTYTVNNGGGSGNSNGGAGGSGGDGATNASGSGGPGPGSDGGAGGNGGSANGGAIYVATGGTLTILDTPISGAAVTGGAAGTAGTGIGPSAINGFSAAAGSAQGAAIYLSGVRANIGVSTGTVTYANTIGGSGLTTGGVNTAINKTGDGTLVLSAANTFTGNVNIAAGTLSIAATASLGNVANDVVMSNGTTLAVTGTTTLANGRAFSIAGTSTIDVATGTTTTLQGVIANGASAGSLVKSGDGTLLLSATNTYTGSTTVNAGTLRVGSANAIPSGTELTIGATGSFDMNGFAGVFGSLAGAGTVTNGGASAAALTTGGNDADSTYSGSIQNGAGAVSLTKTGTGKLTLSGANTYSGATTISGGTLAVNGSIASPVTVIAGGTLGGNGIINNSVSIQPSGAFAPGNSIGTTTVNGSLTFAAGSVYRVEADAAGNSDRINVTGAPGSATINGGTVAVQAGAGSYQASTRYTILNATGGVTGAFSTVSSNLAFLTPSLSYDANNVFLTLRRNDIGFAGVARTQNQAAAAAALQNSVGGATGDMATVLTALTGLSEGQARSVFDAVGGASIVALRRAGAAFANGFGGQLSRRLGLGAAGDAALQVAAFNSPIQLAANNWFSDAPPIYAQAQSSALVGTDRSQRCGRGFWIQGYGDAQDTDGDGNAAGNRLRGSGISAGIDADIGEGLVLGAAVSSGTSRVSFDGLADSGHTRGNALGVYGSYATGPWSFKGVAGLSSNENHSDRKVTVGALARNASADFDSRNLSLYAEAAYDIKQAGYVLQPLAALAYVGTRTNGFTESGAGALNLQVAGQDTHSTRSLLGARTNYALDNVKLQVSALWAHEFGNVNAPMTANFSGAPAAGTFQVNGVGLRRDSLVLGLDASGEIRKGVNLFVSAQAEGNSRQIGIALFGGMRKSF